MPKVTLTKLKPIHFINLSLALLGIIVTVIIARGPLLRLLGRAGGTNTSLNLVYTGSPIINQSFTIPLLIATDDNPVAGIDVKITFDPSMARLQTIDFSPLSQTTLNTVAPADVSTIITNANINGIILFSALAMDQAGQKPAFSNTNQTVLANLTFTAQQEGNTSINFVFDPNQINTSTDTNMVSDTLPPTEILTHVTNVSLTIQPAAPPPPSPSPSPTPLPSPGLINPSFEQDLTGWQTVGGTIMLNNAHTGTKSLRVSQDSAYVSQNIQSTLQPNVPYIISGYVKIMSKSTIKWGKASVRLSKYIDLGTSEYGEASTKAVSDKWVKLSFKRTFSQADLAAPIYLGLKSFGFDGVVLVDDFAISGPAPTPTPTPTPIPPPTTLTYISTGNNAVFQDNTSVTTNPLWLGTATNNTGSYVGLRFPAVNIASDKLIIHAVLKVTSAASQWIGLDTRTYGEKSPNSQVFTTSNPPSSRISTTATISTSTNDQWDINTVYTYVDVTPIINEIITDPDWVANNALSLIIKGTGTPWGRKAINNPTLEITFQ